jgi:hypothetical protein
MAKKTKDVALGAPGRTMFSSPGPSQVTGSRGRASTARTNASGFSSAPAQVSGVGLPDPAPAPAGWATRGGCPEGHRESGRYASPTVPLREVQNQLADAGASPSTAGIDFTGFRSGRE